MEGATGRVYVTGRGVVPNGIRVNEIVKFQVHTDKPLPNDNLKTKVVGPGTRRNAILFIILIFF